MTLIGQMSQYRCFWVMAAHAGTLDGAFLPLRAITQLLAADGLVLGDHLFLPHLHPYISHGITKRSHNGQIEILISKPSRQLWRGFLACDLAY